MIDKLVDAVAGYVNTHTVKQIITPPLLLLAISIVIIAGFTAIHGTPVSLGLEFEGGVMATLDTAMTDTQLETEFTPYGLISVRDAGNRKLIQFGSMDQDAQMQLTEYINSKYPDSEIMQIGQVYSTELQKQAIIAVLFAFFGMAIIVFFIFRSVIPSGAVVLSAFSDIVIAAAFMNIAGIELTVGTVAALLMLIGYSVDSDILLTTRLLKRRGTMEDNISHAMKTGMTMTLTTLAALVMMYLVSTFSYLVTSFSQITIISDISAVLIFGLAADLLNTWLLNTGILKWYIETAPQRKASQRKASQRRAQS